MLVHLLHHNLFGVCSNNKWWQSMMIWKCFSMFHWMNHHSDPWSNNSYIFLYCNPGPRQNLAQFLHICCQPEDDHFRLKREHEICNTWQGRDEAGFYEAAGGRSCSRVPWRPRPFQQRRSPTPSPWGWAARRKSWRGPRLTLSFLKVNDWYLRFHVSWKQLVSFWASWAKQHFHV